MYDNWASDGKCCKFLNWDVHKYVNETKSIIQSWVNEYEKGSYNWIVILKGTNQAIGSISAITISKKLFTAELGYCYGSRFWENGYATQALITIIKYLLTECYFHLIEARQECDKRKNN